MDPLKVFVHRQNGESVFDSVLSIHELLSLSATNGVNGHAISIALSFLCVSDVRYYFYYSMLSEVHLRFILECFANFLFLRNISNILSHKVANRLDGVNEFTMFSGKVER